MLPYLSRCPQLGVSGKAALGGRFADRERRNVVDSRPTAFGKAGGNSRHCQAAVFLKNDRLWQRWRARSTTPAHLL